MKYKKLLAGLGSFALCVQLVGCATIPKLLNTETFILTIK